MHNMHINLEVLPFSVYSMEARSADSAWMQFDLVCLAEYMHVTRNSAGVIP